MRKAMIALILPLMFVTRLVVAADGYEPYTVKNGDTLPKIAEQTLKDSKYLAQLLKYNNISVPSQITPGLQLKVPFSISKNRIAEITLTVGDVKVNTGSGLIAATKGVILMQNHTIVTGAGSKAEVQLDEGSVVRVGPQTQFALKQYAYNAGSRSTDLSLDRGNMSMKVTKLTGDSNFRVTTVTAVAGVRGTFFYVNYDPNSKEVGIAVYSGQVIVGEDKNGDGQIENLKVTVNKGYATTITAEGNASPVFEIPAKIEWANDSE